MQSANRSRCASESSKRSSRPSAAPPVAAAKPRVSKNFGSVAKKLHSDITRAFTAADKRIASAKEFIDVPDVNYDAATLTALSRLRKEMMVSYSMIDNNRYFDDSIEKIDLLLSEKERQSLRGVIQEWFDSKPRVLTVNSLCLGIEQLQRILTENNVRFDEELNAHEVADISESLTETPDEGDDGSDAISSGCSGNEFASDSEPEPNEVNLAPTHHANAPAFAPDPQGTEAMKGAPRIPRVRKSVVQDGGVLPGVTNATQVDSTIVQIPMGLLGDPVGTHNGRDVRRRLNVTTAPIVPAPPTISCPLCSENHELLFCKRPSSDVTKFCACNDLCIYCTSASHKAQECPIRPVTSPVRAAPTPSRQQPAGGRFEATGRPLNSSTPHEFVPYDANVDNASIFMQPTHGSSKERGRFVFDDAPRHFKYPLHTDCKVDEESNRLPSDSKGLVRSRHFSFKDIDEMLPTFNADPVKYKRFIRQYTSTVLNDPRLDSETKLSILDKKLVGRARKFLSELDDPAEAIAQTLTSFSDEMAGDVTSLQEILARFNAISFQDMNLRMMKDTLLTCRSVVDRLRELGEDVDNTVYIRLLIQKFPDKFVRKLMPLFDKNGKPSAATILQRFREYLSEMAFADKMKLTVPDSRTRVKEFPEESVMIAQDVSITSGSSSNKKSPGQSQCIAARQELARTDFVSSVQAPQFPYYGAQNGYQGYQGNEGVTPVYGTFFRGPSGASQ